MKGGPGSSEDIVKLEVPKNRHKRERERLKRGKEIKVGGELRGNLRNFSTWNL
jgi:hypothetical protein